MGELLLFCYGKGQRVAQQEEDPFIVLSNLIIFIAKLWALRSGEEQTEILNSPPSWGFSAHIILDKVAFRK